MALVRIDLRRPDSPSPGFIIFTPTKRRHINTPPGVDGDHIVLPYGVRVDLEDGVATVELAPTSGAWCWRINERGVPAGDKGTDGEGYFAAVPDVETVDYGDLVRVNPATLDPAAEPEAAWWAGLADHNAETSAARDAAIAAEQGAGAAETVAVGAAESSGLSAAAAEAYAEQAQASALAALVAREGAETAAAEATNAEGHATAAQAARTGAETAQGDAEDARDAAQTAQTDSESARDAAAGSATQAGTSATQAAGSAGAAAGSATAAAGSASSAAGAVTAGINAHVTSNPRLHPIYGTGDPNGVVAAPVGSTFRNTEAGGYNGARVWRKDTDTGTTGWVVESGDTGWRNMSATLDSAWSTATGAGRFRVKRLSKDLLALSVRLRRETAGGSRPGSSLIITLPNGVRPESYAALGTMTVESGVAGGLAVINTGDPGQVTVYRATIAGSWAVGDIIAFEVICTTSNAWPTTLPGTPA